jgi:hypothetical protein
MHWGAPAARSPHPAPAVETEYAPVSSGQGALLVELVVVELVVVELVVVELVVPVLPPVPEPPVPEPPVPLAVPDELRPLLVDVDAPEPPLPCVVLVPVPPQPYAIATAIALDAPKRSQDLMRTSSAKTIGRQRGRGALRNPSA